MLEIRQALRRAGAISASPNVAFRDVSVRPFPGGARFSLRTSPRAGDAAFGLGLPINRLWIAEDRFSARLGPDEWLVGGWEDDVDRLPDEIAEALRGRPHAVVDVSHRNVSLEICGPRAADALNAGCPLDLSDAVFPAGTATRTLLGKAEIVLMRAGDEPVFRVECWRSFSPYVFAFLTEAARTAAA